MASAAKAALSTNNTTESEKIVGFSPTALRAPFSLRCAAVSIDYILLLVFPAGWLVLGKLFSDGASPVISPVIWVVGTTFFLFNFLVLPIFRGQTIGKMLTGLTIINLDGTRVRIGRLVLRNTVGYLLTLLTGGLGFVISALNSNGRTLHDFVSGTMVVRGRKTQL